MDTHDFVVTHPETGEQVKRMIAAETRAAAAAIMYRIGFKLSEEDASLLEQEASPYTDEVLPSENQAPPQTIEEAIKRMADDGDADPEGTARMNYRWLFDPKPTTAEEAIQIMTDEGVFDPVASAKHYWPAFFEEKAPEPAPKPRKPRKPKE